MDRGATVFKRRAHVIVLGAAVLVPALVSIAFSAARAEETAVMRRGDAAVTAFSGAKTAADVPSKVHPLDVTFIDTEAPSLQVFDLTKLGGPPAGQLADAPAKLKVKAGDIGQVFGVALDSGSADAPPSIYAGATSMYGLQIVATKNGKPIRLVKGEPGARWMAGQFGTDKGGGPGSVWRIDGATGAVSLFSTITSGRNENAGPGLGALAFDAVSRELYVANLETGLIHRIDMSGRELGTFDHGVAARPKAGLEAVAYDATKRMDIQSPEFSIEDPGTWGFADRKRLVFAVAVESGRLYYSVFDGPVIWSVGLNADGGFADDARLEIDVTGTPNNNPITAILFDGPGKMYITQRGEIAGSYDYATFARPQASVVYRYTWDETAKSWSEAPDEFAIGLEPPHRSTNGGIAFNYGYDSAGNIDYGKCRETLWTTGEHLREGADAARVDKGGPRIVHGLQGNAKSLAKAASATRPKSGSLALQGDFGAVAESDLEPPYESWFSDNDGTFEDDKAHGHIGTVAIYGPCDKAASAEPARPVVPTPLFPGVPWPVPTPGITIAKTCYPGVIGGKITCKITVTNTGAEPWGPVGFTDATAILAGAGAGAPVLIDSALPDGPDWACTPTPTLDFSCALPPGALLPGASRSVDVVIDTGPIIAGGGSGFRNCAALDLPWAGVACDVSAAEIIVTKTAPAVCPLGGGCTFGLTITNSGGQPFSGDVLLTDSMFVGGAVTPAPITAIAPPLGCAPDPAALPFSCVAPVSLAPGESKAFSITATMPAAAPNYWAHNCFAASAPGLPPPALPPVPGPGAGPAACAWVKVGNPLPISNLRIQKSPLDCAKTAPDTVRCNYEIRIWNDGPSDFNDLISIKETVPPAGVLAPLPAPWICLADTCGTAAAVAIPSGGSLSVPVSIDIPRDPLEAAQCWAPNTVAITAPAGGTDPNFNAGDDTAMATADAALIRFDWGGFALWLCDPTNLKTTKVADGDCAQSGGGSKCKSVVTITNTGPDPFHGPIEVKDVLGFAPSSVDFSAPWSCAGAGAAYLCKHAPLDLAKGESVKLVVTATVPKGPQCVLRNRATMILPLANTRWNSSGADDSASATARIPSPDCDRKPTCEQPAPNEFRTVSGACACKEGLSRGRDGQCKGAEESAPPPGMCPDGKPIPRNGVCPCEAGLTWNKETNRCEGACEPGDNEYRTSAGQCVCKTGYLREDGACVVPSEPEHCEPGPNEYRNQRGRCVCKEGYHRSDGRCVKERAPERCDPGPNEYRNEDGRCVCKEGYERDSNGRCMPVTKPCTPGANEYRNQDGQCVCKSGYVRDGKGRCVEQIGPGDICRQRGGRWTGETCAFPANPAEECKKKGWTWTGQRCVEPTNPAEECKKKHWIWTGQRCVEPATPAEECKKKGGNWTGGKCVFPPSPEELCKQRDGTWKNGQCVTGPSPAEICKQKGGIWKKGRCLPGPAAACKKRGGTWKDGKCVTGASPATSGQSGTVPNLKGIILKAKPQPQPK